MKQVFTYSRHQSMQSIGLGSGSKRVAVSSVHEGQPSQQVKEDHWQRDSIR